MKHLTLVLSIAILFIGCLPKLSNIPRKENFYTIDFRKYTEKGFLITPEKYQDAYESIGIIDFVLMPGAEYALVKRELNPYYKAGDPASERYIDIRKWVIEDISIDIALDTVHSECIKMGANALVNFELELNEEAYTNFTNPVIITGMRITGFAIRRIKSE